MTVHLVVDAELDLVELHRYVARHDSPMRADRLLGDLEEACSSWPQCPTEEHPAGA